MDPSIEMHREQLRALCSRFQVKKLELFGSGGRPDFDPARSDLDFLVEFLDLEEGTYADTYFGLLESLEQLFGRHVDLVMPSAIRNPYFLKNIERSRQLLYAA